MSVVIEQANIGDPMRFMLIISEHKNIQFHNSSESASRYASINHSEPNRRHERQTCLDARNISHDQ